MAKIALSDIVCHLSRDNLPVSNQFLTFLMLRIDQVDAHDASALIIPIEELMLLQDSCNKERVEIFLANFLSLMKFQLQDKYLPYSYMIDLFIRVILKSSSLQAKVKENTNDFKFLRSWLNNNPNGIVENVWALFYYLAVLD